MSSPPSQPENAAPLVPESPSPACPPPEAGDGAVGQGAGSVAANAATAVATPGHARGETPPEEESLPPQTNPPTKAAPTGLTSPSPPSLEPIKKAPAPTLIQRPNGPSLLTQALASARGIPPQTQRDGSSQSSHTHLAAAVGDPSGKQQVAGFQKTTNNRTQDPHDAHENDGDNTPVTPRGTSRSSGMASTAAAATPSSVPLGHRSAVPTVYNVLDLGEVSSMLRGHRDSFNNGKSRALSTDRSERDRSDEGGHTGTRADSPQPGDIIVCSTVAVDAEAAQKDASSRKSNAVEPHVPLRACKMEQRVSMGPEKAWSIGSAELAHAQDGQVEKSITDVLAGVEHNARSRKASHSLRFFREGLPEERDKSKRRESRPAGTARDKSSATTEMTPEAGRAVMKEVSRTGADQLVAPRAVESTPAVPSKLSKMQTLEPDVPSSGQQEASAEDYFGDAKVDTSDRDHAPPVHKSASGRETQQQTPAPPPAEPTTGHPSHDSRRKSGDSTEAGENAEDGDESGEEKISSAVFLPHQGLEDTAGVSQPVPGSLQRSDTRSRSISRAEVFHPWLVKADEPEADDDQTPEAEVELRQLHDTQPLVDAIPPQPSGDRGPMLEEREFAQSRPSVSISRPCEDQKQPLDAIELIPYKHQVGGHTTLWRFSKRAVCKQLNNRENEFYERVERYHRDLLSFLPRYIGVLNVTFHKQPRRRSTVRKEDGAAAERKKLDQNELRAAVKTDEPANQQAIASKHDLGVQGGNAPRRVISQSLQSSQIPVPTVTFVDNQHILPRNLLQPNPPPSSLPLRLRSTSAAAGNHVINGLGDAASNGAKGPLSRPTLEDRHANSWGATTVNKKLRNEVFNDAFLKQPIDIQKHRKAHPRSIPRHTFQNILRTTTSDPNLIKDEAPTTSTHSDHSPAAPAVEFTASQSDIGSRGRTLEVDDSEAPKDVTGTSAPEADTLKEKITSPRRKRRYSANGLRRKPTNVSESRGSLKYFEEADDAGYGGDNEDTVSVRDFAPDAQSNGFQGSNDHSQRQPLMNPMSGHPSMVTSGATSPTAEFKKIPRPINPKEAQTQRDSRVEYFLLLEDLTAGMKRPCIMDLKMGTRQYGVNATPKKQKSQQRKCAETTSRELGVRVCGLQVWDARTQNYIFKDKYYGRDLKAGEELQGVLMRFLYDGVDQASILRRIPTVLHKLGQLEVIIRRLCGYRFYAASLLMFYDADPSADDNDTAVEDSTTDFATDNEENREGRWSRKNKGEIDFKMADFANSVIWGDLTKDKPCPPRHPNEPDAGFLRGLKSLREYFLQIQQETRLELGLAAAYRNGSSDGEPEVPEDEGCVSE